ncbi:hypothetical protein A9Q99_07095 [Gammaproteobacteria bacterium 45_16_T64]|nr:hypothetical protein A9Q99_07095 [Gammaproteobacteria bacterium 45_16_T64]
MLVLNRVYRSMLRASVVIASLWLAGCDTLILVGPANQHGQTAADTGLVAVDNLILKGDQLRRGGRLSEAAATLERALRLAPRSPDVYVALSRVKLDAGQYGAAKQFAQKALSLFPENTTWKADRAKSEAKWVISEVAKHR